MVNYIGLIYYNHGNMMGLPLKYLKKKTGVNSMMDCVFEEIMNITGLNHR